MDEKGVALLVLRTSSRLPLSQLASAVCEVFCLLAEVAAAQRVKPGDQLRHDGLGRRILADEVVGRLLQLGDPGAEVPGQADADLHEGVSRCLLLLTLVVVAGPEEEPPDVVELGAGLQARQHHLLHLLDDHRELARVEPGLVGLDERLVGLSVLLLVSFLVAAPAQHVLLLLFGGEGVEGEPSQQRPDVPALGVQMRIDRRGHRDLFQVVLAQRQTGSPIWSLPTECLRKCERSIFTKLCFICQRPIHLLIQDEHSVWESSAMSYSHPPAYSWQPCDSHSMPPRVRR